jgi:Kef-type K+ transport system membrane component KefB
MSEILHQVIALRDLLGQHSLFTVGILLVLGYYIGKAVARIGLPEITGFIIAGLLLGETFLGIVPHHMKDSLKIITEVALGLIALTIGSEFSWVKLKRMGREVLIITFVQLVASFITVSVGLLLFKMPLPFALLLGAIASATAPAATVAIVQSLRAHGIFIDYLYGIVALDDAGAVVLFGIIFAMVSSMLGGGGDTGSGVIILHAVLEVIYSLLLGGVCGFVVHQATRKKQSKNEVLIIALGTIFLFTAASIAFHLSPLLANMAAGAVLINLSPRNHRLFRIIEPLTPPIYALFFVIAGTELQPAIIFQKEILVLGGVYIVFRAVGKYGGVYLGSIISKVGIKIRNNLGWCMLPQAGVAIGLVLLIQASPLAEILPPEYVHIVDMMVNIILFSVFVNELIGPPVSRQAIIRGNEMEE